MKGSFVDCRFCHSTDLKVNRANETIQCESCDRILEERYNDFRVAPVNIERDSPYCVVTNDTLAQHKFEGKLEGDPFHSSGFITAFSHLTVQQQGAFTLTARTFSGDLAELERTLADLDIDAAAAGGAYSAKSVLAEDKKEADKKSDAPIATAAATPSNAASAVAVTVVAVSTTGTGLQGDQPRSQVDGRFVSTKIGGKGPTDKTRSCKVRHVLVAYFALLDVSNVVDLTRSEIDEALRLFNKYADASPNVRSKNVECLAMASLVLVLRRVTSGRVCPDLADFAIAANLVHKDLIQGIKNIQQGLDARLAQSSSSISSHMPHFCSVLGMQGVAEKLAIDMGENAMVHNVCSRRNPMSIAAAAIYLACNLEDQKKTQTEICKVTGLTEVTLRKVYKELMSEHQKIIPANYVSKVRIQTLLPVSMCSQRGGLAAHAHASTLNPSHPSTLGPSAKQPKGTTSTGATAGRGGSGGSAPSSAAAALAGIGGERPGGSAPMMMQHPLPAQGAGGMYLSESQMQEHMMAMGQAMMSMSSQPIMNMSPHLDLSGPFAPAQLQHFAAMHAKAVEGREGGLNGGMAHEVDMLPAGAPSAGQSGALQQRIDHQYRAK